MTPLYQDDEALSAAVAPHLSRAAFAALSSSSSGTASRNQIRCSRRATRPRSALGWTRRRVSSKIEPQVQDGEETWPRWGSEARRPD